MSALTVLIVPPEGDVTLLADECGTCPPLMLREPDADDEWLRNWHLPGWSPLIPRGFIERALLLVLDGVPVAMGCDRFVRCVNAVTRSPEVLGRPVLRLLDDYGTAEDVARTAQREAHRIGARVVLLRDGREVTE